MKSGELNETANGNNNNLGTVMQDSDALPVCCPSIWTGFLAVRWTGQQGPAHLQKAETIDGWIFPAKPPPDS